MTREEILALSGKDLDWEVAKFMGVKKEIFDFSYEAGNFNYSSNISAAWEIVDTIQQNKLVRLHSNDGDHLCKIGGDLLEYKWTSNSMPEAICRAALLAVMEETP